MCVKIVFLQLREIGKFLERSGERVDLTVIALRELLPKLPLRKSCMTSDFKHCVTLLQSGWNSGASCSGFSHPELAERFNSQKMCT